MYRDPLARAGFVRILERMNKTDGAAAPWIITARTDVEGTIITALACDARHLTAKVRVARDESGDLITTTVEIDTLGERRIANGHAAAELCRLAAQAYDWLGDVQAGNIEASDSDLRIVSVDPTGAKFDASRVRFTGGIGVIIAGVFFDLDPEHLINVNHQS
jgi:hypothetical protein